MRSLSRTATIVGAIVDANGNPHPKAFVSLRLPDQRKGSALASTGADEQGLFRLTNVLVGTPLEITANRFQKPFESATAEVVNFEHPRHYQMQLTLDAKGDVANLKLSQPAEVAQPESR